MRYLLIAFLALFTSSIQAQIETAEIDSLKIAAKDVAANTDAECAAWLSLGKAYLNWSPDSSQTYGHLALAYARAKQDTAFLAESLHILGSASRRLQDGKQSGIYFHEAYQYRQALEDVELKVLLATNLADYYGMVGESDSASLCLEAAFETLRQHPDTSLIATVNLTYGNIWMEAQNYEKATQYYSESARLYDAIQHPNAALCYVNLGGLNPRKDPEQSVVYLRKAEAIYRKVGDRFSLGIALGNIGSILNIMGRTPEAIEALNEAMVIQEAMSEKHSGAFVVAGTLGNIYAEQGDLDKALKYNLQALELTRKAQVIRQEAFAVKSIQSIYERKGDYKNAFFYLQLHSELQDSILNAENTAAVAALDVKQTYAIEALKDSLEYQKRTEVFASQARVEKRTRYGLIVGLLLVTLFGAVLLNRFRVAQRQKAIIEENAVKLAASEAQRTRFFANISHEFRTPLSVINGMSELIRNNPGKWATKGSQLITDNGKNLLELVNQLLDLQKLEKHELQPVYIQSNVVPFIRGCTSMFEVLAAQKGLAFHFESDTDAIQMDFDREKLLRIVSNLVSNAVKFTDKGMVTVALSQTNLDEQAHLKLTVRDTGIGIPKDQIDRIFQRFYQVDNAQVKAGQGTGIGLNYVNELVELMHGQMEVQSEENQGSAFTVLLPISREAILLESLEIEEVMEVPSRLDYHPSVSEGPELLIIEDNPDIIELLLAHLSMEYVIRVAENGTDGIAASREHTPDLILSDVMMPGKDGFEVLDELKNDRLTSHIPIVMLTAKTDAASRLAGLRRGADDYIGKPFNSEELRIRLRNVLQAQSRFEDRYAQGIPASPSSEPDLELEDAFLIRMREVLEENLSDTEFGIKDFCLAMGTSRTQLHTKLKALTGLSTSIFIRNLRLERAKELLSDQSLSVADVAYKTGFSSPTYFSRMFTQRYDAPPSAFR